MRDPVVHGLLGGVTRRGLVLAALAPAGWPAAQGQGTQQLVRIGRTDDTSPISDIAERVLGEAFERIGVRYTFVPIPWTRLIEMANDGLVDADIGRIPEVADRYPNLVRVPTPICPLELAVYGHTADFAKRTRSEIAAMKLGIVRGAFVLAKHTRGMQVVEVRNFEAAANMVLSQRIDATVSLYLDFEAMLLNRRMPGMVRWPYLWASEPVHFLLHKGQAVLVPRLDDALARMTREGLVQRYYAEGVKKLGIASLSAAQLAPR